MPTTIDHTKKSNTPNDFFLEVSKGNVAGHSHIHKHGNNEDIDTGTEDVWEQGGNINWLTTASILNVTSSDANDTSAGIGARTFKITGLIAGFIEDTEIVTLNGQTIVNTTKAWIRINRIDEITSGALDENAGVIYLFLGTATNGRPDELNQIYTTVAEGHGKTLQAFYTVPAGKTGYMTSFYVNTDSPTKPIKARLKIKKNTDLATSTWEIEIDVKTDTSVLRNFLIPDPIPEKSDIKVTVTADANNTFVSAEFDLILEDN